MRAASIEGELWAGRPLIPMLIQNPADGRSIFLAAMLDTGASHSAITQPVADMLGLEKVRDVSIWGAGLTRTGSEWRSWIQIWSRGLQPENFLSEERILTEMLSPGLGVHCLVGMDIMGPVGITIRTDGTWKLGE